MKNLPIFYIVAVLALGTMLISFSLDQMSGMPTVTRGSTGGGMDCEGTCNALQVDLIAAMGGIQKLTVKYESNTKTVKKLISKWQWHTSALINVSANPTLKNTYPYNTFDDLENLTLYYHNTFTLWKELELVKVEKKKLEMEITKAFLALYELHAKMINCHITCYCPPACTLGERRSRQAMLDCEIDIRQIEQRLTTLEGTYIKIHAEWTKYWELTQTIITESNTIVGLFNQTGPNQWNYTGIGGAMTKVKAQVKKFTAIEKRIVDLNILILKGIQATQKDFSAMIRCIRRKCPTCTETPRDAISVGEGYRTRPRDRVVTGTPGVGEAISMPGGEAPQMNCEQECANRGMTSQPRDWTSQIEADLNSHRCVKSARISFGRKLTLTQGAWSCTCFPTKGPQISYGGKVECPKNNPCEQPVPCDGQISCQKGNTKWTVTCSWGGWKMIAKDIQNMMYQYAPQLKSK